jgi:hypothetical protein
VARKVCSFDYKLQIHQNTRRTRKEMEDLQKNEANLLTLPRSDVGLPMIPTRSVSSAETEEETDTSSVIPKNTYPCLLLLQLPPQWKAEDLKDARFVIPDKQASMVVEGQKTSFVLQRVETSNALVLVPPPVSAPPSTKHKSTTSEQDDDDNAEQQQKVSIPSSPHKRRKITTTEKGLTLRPVQARLLNQGSGAFFLEAKTEPLRLTDLVEQLPVWDPYENMDDVVTVSTESLGNKLAKSQAEVLQGLRDIQALSCDAGHCRLAEEAKLDVLDTVIATLVEAFPHYVSEGIPVREFCNSARVRLPKIFRENEYFAELLTKYCLGTFLTTSSSSTSNMIDETETTLQLDIAKVGIAVASRILTRQSIWEESVFLDKWQEEMPGVECKVSTRWLAGHAVRLSEDTPTQDNPSKKERETTYYWKYLPCSAMVQNAKDSSVVWERLIQAKQTWTAVALEPYLDAWQNYTGEVPAAILRHAAIRTEGDVKIYHAR